MPHIHTEPGQHDFTTSAYIIRKVKGDWYCLVHMHKKLHVLMQVGGHIELNETPWKTLAHELEEETGYTLSDLQLLQQNRIDFNAPDYVVHPVPVMLNTHKFSDTHFHTDIAYAFIAKSTPHNPPAQGESDDIRWLTTEQLENAAMQKEVLQDVASTYRTIVEDCVGAYVVVDPMSFSQAEPRVIPKDS